MWLKSKTVVRKLGLTVAVGGAGLMAQSAFAVSPFDPITAAVTFTDVVAAVMAIAAILAGLYVTLKGVKTVLGMIRRGS